MSPSGIPSIEAIFEAAVAAKVIPGAMLAASSTNGKLKYNKSLGVRSLKPCDSDPNTRGENGNDSHDPLKEDGILWMGSCTKILTAIAALQCVERGYFGLDDDVTGILPELQGIQVRVPGGNDGEGVELVKAKGVITLRRLLNHTSGLSYTKFGNLNLPLVERCLAPLVFEPGEGFMYGTGTDFAGLMVERATNLRLETYIQQNIAVPLGISLICFRPKEHEGVYSRVPDVSLRDKETRSLSHTEDRIWPVDFKEDSGGSGAYTTIPEFQRVLHSLTADDGVLLSGEMVEELFKPDLSEKVRKGVLKTLENETTNNIFGGLPMGTEVSYAMGGMVVLEDLFLNGDLGDGEGNEVRSRRRRPKGSMHWGALLNIFFWMDRKNGISGIFGSQVFPAGDVECLRMFGEFERGVYEAYGELCK